MRQSLHDEEASRGRQDRHGPHEGHSEWTRPIGLLVAQDQHADADEREREQRPDVRQVVSLVRVADEGPHRDDDPREQRRNGGNLRPGVNLRGPLRQQAVPCHREEDARLAVLEDEQHRRHRHRRAERDDPADRVETGELERARERVGHGQLLVRHHPRQHEADNDVDEGADGEAAEDPDRQVALRVLRLLRSRRDRVEADVREEDDCRPLMDAGEPVRRERMEIRGVDVRGADSNEQAQREQLDHHHDVVGGDALLRPLQQQHRD